jgi:uncharacterized membrane protein (DUF106 family)
MCFGLSARKMLVSQFQPILVCCVIVVVFFVVISFTISICHCSIATHSSYQFDTTDFIVLARCAKVIVAK